MRRGGLRVAPLLLALALLVSGAPSLGAGAATLSVKYRSASAVYLDGGKAQGLLMGDRLAVISGSETVAELEIVYLAEHSASCRVVSETRLVRAGDQVTRLPRSEEANAPVAGEVVAVPVAAPSPTPTPAAMQLDPAPATPRPQPLARIRGGVSFGLYNVWDESPADYDFEQRTGRLDLSAWDIGGRALTFRARFRTRQDIRARGLASLRTPADRRDDRLYELSLRYQPPDEKVAFELGRIGASNFVGIGYLDGALAQVRVLPALQVGGFFGRRTEMDNLDKGAPGLKYGTYLRLTPPGRYSRQDYEAILAVVRETADDDVSREYLSLETRFGSGRRFSLVQRGELDLNRGWRREVAGTAYQVSNLSLAANWRASRGSSFVLSYDGRKNYRYYLNRGVPEEVFDDLLHQGLRASFYASRRQGLSVNAGGGLRFRNDRDPVNAYSGNLGVRHANAFGSQVSLGVDGVGFRNGYTDGVLVTAQAGRAFATGHYLDLSYGRSVYNLRDLDERRVTEWIRLTGRFQVVRGFYVVGDIEYDRGDDLQGPRVFLEAGYQF